MEKTEIFFINIISGGNYLRKYINMLYFHCENDTINSF